jgi:hypothetical protein
MQDAISYEEFEEKYGDWMLNGLSSHGTYIPLKTNARVGINIALRPMVLRLDDKVVLFGGKLRVGYTLDQHLNPVKSKVVDLHDDDAENRLAEFCKGFTWSRQSAARFSTIIGVAVAASPYDPEILDKVVEDGLAAEVLNKMESTYSQYNDGATFNHKRKAAAALNDAWIIQAQGLFQEPPEVQKLPEGVLGQKSGKLLNEAQDKYHDNVVSFSQKVAQLKNAE